MGSMWDESVMPTPVMEYIVPVVKAVMPSTSTLIGLAVIAALGLLTAVLYAPVRAWRHRKAVKRIMAERSEEWGKLDTRLIWCVGCSGAGKSTLALRLAAKIGSSFLDLDDVYWLPGWIKRTGDEVRAILEPLFKQGPMVIAGSYDADMGTCMRTNATIIVWIRPSLYMLMWQLISRSLFRILLRRESCAGNYESFYTNFFAPNSILRKTYKSYNRVELRYSALVANPPKRLDGCVVQLRDRAENEAFRRFLIRRKQTADKAITDAARAKAREEYQARQRARRKRITAAIREKAEMFRQYFSKYRSRRREEQSLFVAMAAAKAEAEAEAQDDDSGQGEGESESKGAETAVATAAPAPAPVSSEPAVAASSSVVGAASDDAPSTGGDDSANGGADKDATQSS